MPYLITGLVLFFGVHSLGLAAPQIKERASATLGEMAWKGLYTVLSLTGIALIIWGWTLYRLDAPDLYQPPQWAGHAAALLVAFAFVLITTSYVPTGKIKSTVVHPMMIGITVWSFAHLIANGDLASVMLFGTFFAYAVWYLAMAPRRALPKPVFKSYFGDVLAIVLGLLAYALFAFLLHQILFGVSPF